MVTLNISNTDLVKVLEDGLYKGLRTLRHEYSDYDARLDRGEDYHQVSKQFAVAVITRVDKIYGDKKVRNMIIKFIADWLIENNRVK